MIGKILVVDDDPSVRRVLERLLTDEGYQVATAEDGEEALWRARRDSPDLVTLDVRLPGLDGIEVCRRLRQERATRAIAIVLVTSRSSPVDEVLGLGVGADDFVSKPFDERVLLARIRSVLRRADPADEADESARPLVTDCLRLDPARHAVFVDDEPVEMTAIEFRLLHYLAARAGRVLSRRQLIAGVLGENASVLDRTIDGHIRTIRRKLGSRRDLVETVRGVGYRFED